MALSYKTSLRNSKLDQITSAVGGSGKFRFYNGTPPADANTALSGNTLLAELTLNATYAPSANSGVLTLNAITSTTNAAATGTASFWRHYDSAGTTCYIQGTAGTSGTDVTMNTTSIVSGSTVSCSSFTITAGNP